MDYLDRRQMHKIPVKTAKQKRIQIKRKSKQIKSNCVERLPKIEQFNKIPIPNIQDQR